MESQHFNAADVWEKLGITEHLGGTSSTERLIARLPISSASSVLDIGCGTGYTACLLASRYGTSVVAADVRETVLRHARERVERQSLGHLVRLVQTNIHAMDFPPETYDMVIAESVLVFCDKVRATADVFRVLKHGGCFGANEFTFLKPPPPDWRTMLATALGLEVQPLLAEEWRNTFECAGFVTVSSEVSHLSLRENFRSHLRVDGWRKYVTAVARGLALPGVWRTFFNRNMLRAWREYPDYVGYGLYVSQKP